MFKIARLSSYLATLDELASSNAGRRRTIFGGAKLEAWRQKNVYIFQFLQSDIVSGIVTPFREQFMPSLVRKVA